MLVSMTGYGRAKGVIKDKNITIELRSLNSKFTDLRFKMPMNYKEKEPELRKIISKKAERGKIDLSINIESLGGDDGYTLNHELFKKYYLDLTRLTQEMKMPHAGDLTQAILRIPNVVKADESSITEEEWNAVVKILKEALENFHQYRVVEGEAMEKDCEGRINNIMKCLGELEPFEAERVVKLKERMLKNLGEYVGKDKIDANRFEQEIIYYLEKIDVTEEKVRLAQHCKYFLEEMNKKAVQKGRKLNFISQEIGREINTLGSKAASSDIQHLVVQMKDELEKIKELVANSV